MATRPQDPRTVPGRDERSPSDAVLRAREQDGLNLGASGEPSDAGRNSDAASQATRQEERE